jgi:hypothetical protein
MFVPTVQVPVLPKSVDALTQQLQRFYQGHYIHAHFPR